LDGRASFMDGKRGGAANASRRLDGVEAAFARTNANGLLDIGDENLAVADTPGLGCLADGFDGALDQLIRENDLDLHLGQEIHDIFGAAIKFRVPLLASETLRLGNR